MGKLLNPLNNNVMKTFRFFVTFILVSMGYPVLSQNSIFPDISVYALDGSRMNARDIRLSDQTVVIVFWNGDDRKSLDQVRMINEEYGNGLKEKNVKVVGICTDNSGIMERIRPLVNGIGLDFEIYIDRNNDLKRAMNVPEIPYTLIIDPVKDFYCRYSGYCANIGELITGSIDQRLAKNIDQK